MIIDDVVSLLPRNCSCTVVELLTFPFAWRTDELIVTVAHKSVWCPSFVVCLAVRQHAYNVVVPPNTPTQIAVFTFSSFTATRLNIERVSRHSVDGEPAPSLDVRRGRRGRTERPPVYLSGAMPAGRPADRPAGCLTCHTAPAQRSVDAWPTCETRVFFTSAPIHWLQTRFTVKPPPPSCP